MRACLWIKTEADTFILQSASTVLSRGARALSYKSVQ